jgi:hypothetical protein
MSIRWKLIFSGYAIIAILSFTAVTTLTARPAVAKNVTQDRPILVDEQTFGDEHFFIHYTLSGKDAVAPTDSNINGIPDYIEQVLAALNTAYHIEVVQLGWTPPPGDLGEGGDSRLDVYIQELMDGGVAGYTNDDGGYLGDNPATPEEERRATYSYIGLDNDFAELPQNPGASETPLALMQATVAHELNHAIQAGYDAFDPQSWLYEATSSWMEDEVFDDSNDTILYVQDVFSAPDQCRVAEKGWYGSWLFLRLMSERYGHDVVRSIWEQSRRLDGFDAIDAALAPYGSSLQIESRDFAVANLLRAYEEGANYPTIDLEGVAEPGVFVPQTGIQSLGADTIQVRGSGTVAISLNASEDVLSMRAVGVQGGQADVIDAANGSLIVNLDNYQGVYIVVHNDERTDLQESCSYTSYSLEIVSLNLPPTTVVAVWPAQNFLEPKVGTSNNLDGSECSTPYPPSSGRSFVISNFVEEPRDLNVPFSPIVPTVLPPGYSLDYAYAMTARDLGTSAEYYMPGGGISANYDLINQADNRMSVAQSPSPYDSLQGWLGSLDYFAVVKNPGQIRTTADTIILIEDLSGTSNIHVRATFVLDGLFIVIDGDHSVEDVMALAENLITTRTP